MVNRILKKRNFWVLASSLGLILLLNFQNCSKTHFSQLGTSNPTSVDSASSEPFLINPETPQENNPIGKQELVVLPVDNSPKPLEFVFIIDESYSNVTNAQSVVNSLKDFILKLPDSTLSVKFYFIGINDGLVEQTQKDEVISATRKRHTIDYSVKVKPLIVSKENLGQASDFRAAFDQAIIEVNKRLSDSKPGRVDTSPRIKDEILALMGERKNTGTKTRTVYVVITDEDINQNYGISGAAQKRVMDSQSIQQFVTESVTVPVDCLSPAEGGGMVASECSISGCSTCSPKINSCSDTVGIRNEIANRNSYANRNSVLERSDTFSKCQFSPGRTVTAWQGLNDSLELTTYSGKIYRGNSAYNLMPTIEKEILLLTSLPDQPQYFVGLFSILSLADVKNSDQEVSVILQRFVNSITPNENRHFQSLTSSDFSPFLEKVKNFKLKTENNRFSADPILSKIPVGKKLIISKVSVLNEMSQSYVETKKFIHAGNEIVIQDLNFNFQTGGKISVEYSYSN